MKNQFIMHFDLPCTFPFPERSGKSRVCCTLLTNSWRTLVSDPEIIPLYKVINRMFTTLYGIITVLQSAKFSPARYNNLITLPTGVLITLPTQVWRYESPEYCCRIVTFIHGSTVVTISAVIQLNIGPLPWICNADQNL